MQTKPIHFCSDCDSRLHRCWECSRWTCEGCDGTAVGCDNVAEALVCGDCIPTDAVWPNAVKVELVAGVSA